MKIYSAPLGFILVQCLGMSAGHAAELDAADACEALSNSRDQTIQSSSVVAAKGGTPSHCYVRGLIPPSTQYHIQLPLPSSWNARFLMWGDGGKDGDLDFSNSRLTQGYAVANSNTGHDNSETPGSQFGLNNREAEIDFGYRAVHLTTLAGKALVESYYRAPAQYSYFEGCSTGGRQGLMEAQRYAQDFDGIVAGAPVNFYQAMNAAGVWWLQRMFKDNFAGNLAVDTNGDGDFDSVRLVNSLHEKVLEKCDAGDGIVDGIVSRPQSCDFNPVQDLSEMMCAEGTSTDACFTTAQVQTIADFYSGPYDDQGTVLYPGKAFGSELDWINLYVPHAGNGNAPRMLVGPAGDHVNYLFYEDDPGVVIADMSKPYEVGNGNGQLPEFSWIDFDINDLSAGKATLMQSIMDATDTDLTEFLQDHDGKLLLYHGWTDSLSSAKATVQYFEAMVQQTFAGSYDVAGDRTRLFLAPGMGHCGGGNGPNSWDKLSDLVRWVELDEAPESIVATHSVRGEVDNERLLCPFPQQAHYNGPAAGANDNQNWIAENFVCR
jgi:feruloyl esterase